MRGEAIVPFVLVMAIEGAAGPYGRATSAIDDPEAYRVYEAVFTGKRPAAGAGPRQIVIRAETVRRDDCGLSGPALEREWKTVVESFKRENATARVLLPGFTIQPPYALVTSAELASMFAQGRETDAGWGSFYEAFPGSGGYFEVSAVGFDRGRTHAMVYVANRCGILCGGGTHYLLEKVDEVWREADPEGLSRCQWMALGIAPVVSHPLESTASASCRAPHPYVPIVQRPRTRPFQG